MPEVVVLVQCTVECLPSNCLYTSIDIRTHFSTRGKTTTTDCQEQQSSDGYVDVEIAVQCCMPPERFWVLLEETRSLYGVNIIHIFTPLPLTTMMRFVLSG